jgi:hypothetical protein
MSLHRDGGPSLRFSDLLLGNPRSFLYLGSARVAALLRRNVVEIVGDVEDAAFIDPAKVLRRPELRGAVG